VPSGERLDDDAGDVVSQEPAGELFYRGTLIRLSRGGGHGVVRSASTGREVPFEFQHVVVLGDPGRTGAVELREGMTVGYDVGWTSRGLRVTKIFTIPPREASAITAEDPSGT